MSSFDPSWPHGHSFVSTHSGKSHPVRILITDRQDSQLPIVFCYQTPEGTEGVMCCTRKGKNTLGEQILFNNPAPVVKKSAWINIYRATGGEGYYTYLGPGLYDTEEHARQFSEMHRYGKHVATIPIAWEEPENRT
jgi:hypothetical protein